MAEAMPGVVPAGFPHGGEQGPGVMPGAIGPAGLTAAAAGGGGGREAGSGWATQRGAAQREGGAAAPYGNRPAMLPPQVAREAAARPAQRPGMPHGQPVPEGDGPVTESLREELSALRKQVADLAMERDVLMRSAAMWAQQAAEQRPDG